MIPLAKPDLSGNELKYVTDCIQSGWISKGKYITKFEDMFSKFMGGGHSTTVCNGTVALHLALETLGIKEGDEVIVPDLTYIASANAVSYTGAKVVLCDVEKDSWCMCPKDMESKITKRTKAIMPVHLYGRTANMFEICKIAKKYNLFVIEDCAEALGASIYDIKVGNFSDISCFSFFGNKIISTGEGGMCFTKNKKLDAKMKHLRNHAIVSQGVDGYTHDCIGYNYRMTNVQAAIGLAQMERIKYFLKERDKIDKWYRICFDMSWKPKGYINWLFTYVNSFYNIKKLTKYLQTKGIESRPVFTQLSKMEPYKKIKGGFKNSAFISQFGITLPTWVGMTEKDVKQIVETIEGCEE